MAVDAVVEKTDHEPCQENEKCDSGYDFHRSPPVVFGWQKDKLQSQANKFTDKQLKEIVSRALTLDVAVKTGILNTDTALTRLLLFFQ